MKQTDGAEKQLELLLQRYPILAGQREEIDGAYRTIAASYEAGGNSSSRATAARQRMRNISWAS